MFEALGERLAAALKKISGRGVLRPEDVEAGLREVRLALLEADVNFKVVKEFVERVRARVAGVEISPGLTAPQTVIKAVNEELVELLGGNAEGLRYAAQPLTVLMLVGLQGSGKTTTAVKLALLARKLGLELRVAAEANSIRLQHEIAASAAGYAITAEAIAPHDRHRLVALKIVDPVLERGVVLAVARQRPHTPATRETHALVVAMAPGILAESGGLQPGFA